MPIDIKFIQGAGTLANNTPVTIYTVPANRRARLLWNNFAAFCETVSGSAQAAELTIRISTRPMILVRGAVPGSSSFASMAAFYFLGASPSQRYVYNQNSSLPQGQIFEDLIRRCFSGGGYAATNLNSLNQTSGGQLFQDADLERLYLMAGDTVQLNARAFAGTYNAGQYSYGISIIEEF